MGKVDRPALCNRGQRRISSTYAGIMMMIDGTDRPERLARIERLIDEYQSVKRRRIVRRAMRLWRCAETDQQLAKFEAPPERIH